MIHFPAAVVLSDARPARASTGGGGRFCWQSLCRGLLLPLVLLLAACRTEAPAPPPSSDDDVTGCLNEMTRLGVPYERLRDWTTAEGCGIHGAIRTGQLSLPWAHTLTLSCKMALRLWQYEKNILQPTAQSILGQKIRRVIDSGSYNCRRQNGNRPEHLSLHAYGLAVDISGFDLANGTTVLVRRDWKLSDEKGRFLREISKKACKEFSIVLTPNYNAAHYDHIHLDLGPSRACGL